MRDTAFINALCHTDPLIILNGTEEQFALRLAVAMIVNDWKYPDDD